MFAKKIGPAAHKDQNHNAGPDAAWKSSIVASGRLPGSLWDPASLSALARVSRIQGDQGQKIVTNSMSSLLGGGHLRSAPLTKTDGLATPDAFRDSSLDPERVRLQPATFADTGLSLLSSRAPTPWARLKNRLCVIMVGGSQVMDESDCSTSAAATMPPCARFF